MDKLTVENYFEDINLSDNCLIIDEGDIKLLGHREKNM